MGFLIFVIGAIFGSFYLVIGTRLPKNENVITGRSKCDSCDHVLKWYELIPLLSFIFLGGKCLNCGQKIAKIHFLLELVTAGLFLGGYYYFGLTIKYGIYLVLISLTLIIFVSDFKYMIISDEPLIIGSIFLIILKYFEVGFLNTVYAIIYGIISFSLMYLISIFGKKIFKKESLGGGDIKLSFLIGLTLGYYPMGFRLSLIALLFSAFLAFPYAIASVYLNKKNELPYGPFLISATVIIFIFIEKFAKILQLISYAI